MFTPGINGIHEERSHVRAYQSALIVWIRLIGILRWLPVMIVATCFSVAARGQQNYLVDCSGANPNDFPTISSALAVAGPGSIVLVTGTCTENVTIWCLVRADGEHCWKCIHQQLGLSVSLWTECDQPGR